MLESHKSVHCVLFQVGNGYLPFLSSFLLHSSCMSFEMTRHFVSKYFNEKINTKNRFVKLAPLLFKENALHSKPEYFLNLGTSTLDLQYRINGINHVVVSQGCPEAKP